MNLLFITYKVDAADPLVGFAVGWLNALAARLNRLEAICLARGPAALRDNVTVYSLGKERGASKAAQAAAFYRAAWKAKTDAVFCQFSPIFVMAIAPVAKLRGWPVVMWYTHRRVDLKLRIATALADRVVTASPESFGLPGPKVHVIGHGIDIEKFSPNSEARIAKCAVPPSQYLIPNSLPQGGRKAVLAVGRIAPIKNYETLIEAASRVTASRADVEFLVAGDVQAAGLDDYAEGLKRMVVERGLAGRFRFLGAVPHHEIPDLYRRATVAVNLCPTGGLDKAVLEGLAAGVPTVLCNRSFAPLFGDAGQTAFIPERDAAALTEKLCGWLDTPEEARRAWGAQMRERVIAEHSLETWASRIREVFAELE